tara:strand:- start:293 stop:556 length:264 start_codon:yes stop_codon:yes gene_type:complete
MNKEKKVKKTYLTRVLDVLSVYPEEPISWYILFDKICENWDDTKEFDSAQLIKNGIIRGIKLNKIEKIEDTNIKTKYLGHIYKMKLK